MEQEVIKQLRKEADEGNATAEILFHWFTNAEFRKRLADNVWERCRAEAAKEA